METEERCSSFRAVCLLKRSLNPETASGVVRPGTPVGVVEGKQERVMSAGDRWHEHGPVKDGDPAISSAVLRWMQGQGGTETSDLPWLDPETAFRPEPAGAGNPESEDVLSNLLRAIENTDVAARFQNAAPPDQGHPSADARRDPVKSAEAVSAMLKPPETSAVGAASAERTSAVGDESNEALEMLLRAIQSARIAAKLEGAPKADGAEAIGSSSGQPAEAAETPSTLTQEPETDAAAHLEEALQVASGAGEHTAVALEASQSSDADVRLDGVPTPSDRDSAEIASLIASLEPAETTLILESPVVAPLPAAARHENRQPRRAPRRRLSGRQRVDYLLSIAAPTAALPGDAAEPEPAKPLPVVSARTVAEPELPVTTEPARAIATELELPVTPKPARSVASEPAPISVAPRLPAAADGAASKTPMPVRRGMGIGSFAATGGVINGGLDRAEMHLEVWFQKWFGPPDPRHNMRVENPPLVAYHWIVDVPQALKIADVSASGLRLITKDRWSEGNIVSMTLQRTDMEKGSPDSWIAVDFLVMRWCEGGVAGSFIASSPGLTDTVAGRAGNCADKKTLERFMDRLIDAYADRMAVTK